MSRYNTYAVDRTPQLSDILLGSAQDRNGTSGNFNLEDIGNLLETSSGGLTYEYQRIGNGGFTLDNASLNSTTIFHLSDVSLSGIQPRAILNEISQGGTIVVQRINALNGNTYSVYTIGGVSDGIQGITNLVVTSVGGPGGLLTDGDKIKIYSIGGGTGGGGQANQNAFGVVTVPGQPTITAEAHVDQLNMVAGDGITITTDSATDTITFEAVAPDISARVEMTSSVGATPDSFNGVSLPLDITANPINLNPGVTVTSVTISDGTNNSGALASSPYTWSTTLTGGNATYTATAVLSDANTLVGTITVTKTKLPPTNARVLGGVPDSPLEDYIFRSTEISIGATGMISNLTATVDTNGWDVSPSVPVMVPDITISDSNAEAISQTFSFSVPAGATPQATPNLIASRTYTRIHDLKNWKLCN